MLRKGEVPLCEEVHDVLAAMQHVYTKAPTSDRTFQQRNLRAMKDANPVGFYDRMTELETNKGPQEGATWDGLGHCPACNRPPGEVDALDESPGLAEIMIEELLGPREKAIMDRFDRHKAATVAWWDQEGMK
jgi:hypothetical protein